jgi:hypothetical protein
MAAHFALFAYTLAPTHGLDFMRLYFCVSSTVGLRIGLGLGSRSKRNILVQETWRYNLHVYTRYENKKIGSKLRAINSIKSIKLRS